MGRYKLEVYSKITGELKYSKLYEELFPTDGRTKKIREIKMISYVSMRFGIHRSNLEAISCDV